MGVTLKAARIVQLTDTHFSAAAGVPAQWPATLRWLREDPPDLVVHSGDIVLEDPDDDADRDFARRLLTALPAPLHCIPGNHDVGMYGDDGPRARRVATFRETWGDDRFADDLVGWRVIGVDAYLLGDEEHDAWLRRVARVPRPVLAFIHQPLEGDPCDGWEMPPAARQTFELAVDGADLRVIASGHRHAAARFGRAVWAPSLTLEGDAAIGGDPCCGVVEHVIRTDGHHESRVVRPWEAPPASA